MRAAPVPLGGNGRLLTEELLRATSSREAGQGSWTPEERRFPGWMRIGLNRVRTIGG